MMIDIGAGTLDVSLCDVIRKNNDSFYKYYPLACLVEGLGVSNFVKARLDKVYKLTEQLSPGQKELVKKSLFSVKSLIWLFIREISLKNLLL